MTDNDLRNRSPHKSARAAMLLYNERYARQRGGSMDFWDTLNDSERETCRRIITEIDASPDEFLAQTFTRPLQPDPVSVVVASMRESVVHCRSLGDNWEADWLEGFCDELEAATTGGTPNG